MSRHSIIRALVASLASAAAGYALANACARICTAASLGAFLSFLVWLLGAMTAGIAAVQISRTVERVVTNERIDSAQAWLSGLRAKVLR